LDEENAPERNGAILTVGTTSTFSFTAVEYMQPHLSVEFLLPIKERADALIRTFLPLNVRVTFVNDR